MERNKRFWEIFHAAWREEISRDLKAYSDHSWLYVQVRLEEHFEDNVKPRNFWEIFHAAWGEDSKTNGGTYDKISWLYVQSRLEEYLKKKVTPGT